MASARRDFECLKLRWVDLVATGRVPDSIARDSYLYVGLSGSATESRWYWRVAITSR